MGLTGGHIRDQLKRIDSLEREVAALRQHFKEYESPERGLVFEPPGYWLRLDEYELVNLREALRSVQGDSPLSVLNSGDWHGQILGKLESHQFNAPSTRPNWTAEEYRLAAEGKEAR